MKNLLKLGMALLMIAMMFGFVGCFEPEEDDTEESLADFNNYKSNPALRFNNRTGQPLVLFKGSVSEKNKIGGISVSDNHGVKRNADLFTKTEAFPVIVVTLDQYKEAKKKGTINSSSIPNPFTVLYVFYNTNADASTPKVIEISDYLSSNQQYYLEVTMPMTNMYNVELRLGGTGGEPLGYVHVDMAETKFYLVPNKDFVVFPVFHRWNQWRNVLETIYPKYDYFGKGQAEAIGIDVKVGPGSETQLINMRDVFDTLKNDKPNVGSAYIIFENGSTSKVRVVKGTTVIRDSFGSALFGSENLTYQLPMSGSPETAFASEALFAGFSVGGTGKEQPVKDQTGNDANFQAKNGCIYRVNISSSGMTGSGVVTSVINTENYTEIGWDTGAPAQ